MTIAEMVAALSEPVPPNYIRQKEASDGQLEYIPWHLAAELADLRTGGRWSYAIREWVDRPVMRGSKSRGYELVDMAHCVVTVTLHGDDGRSVSRDAVGVDDDPMGQRGTAYERATGAGMRRALAAFGLGRHLYNKARAVASQPSSQPSQPARKPSAPRAPARSAPAPVDLVAIVDSLRAGAPLPDVMRAIQKSGASPGEIHAAWCDAIGMAADLCRDGDDLAAVNATYDKIKGRLTDQQRGACGAAIDAARVDINERALHVPGDA